MTPYRDDQAKTESGLPKLQIKPCFTIKIIYIKSYATILMPIKLSKHFINSSAHVIMLTNLETFP